MLKAFIFYLSHVPPFWPIYHPLTASENSIHGGSRSTGLCNTRLNYLNLFKLSACLTVWVVTYLTSESLIRSSHCTLAKLQRSQYSNIECLYVSCHKRLFLNRCKNSKWAVKSPATPVGNRIWNSRDKFRENYLKPRKSSSRWKHAKQRYDEQTLGFYSITVDAYKTVQPNRK